MGVVRDTKFAGFAFHRPARPMFFVPLAKNVTYKNDLMNGLDRVSHFISGIMLVTNQPPGLSPLLPRRSPKSILI